MNPKIHVRMDADQHRRIRERAKRLDVSVSTYLRLLALTDIGLAALGHDFEVPRLVKVLPREVAEVRR